jgi:hypothetical protein
VVLVVDRWTRRRPPPPGALAAASLIAGIMISIS